MAVTNCLKGSLQEYVPSPSKPWNEKRVHHLYNKLSNGAPNSLIKAALSNGPGLVDYLLTTAKSHPLQERFALLLMAKSIIHIPGKSNQQPTMISVMEMCLMCIIRNIIFWFKCG
ncbi:MAG: hypothetical protein IPL98_00605 [Saprospiraceae bacterium]|nr:hypothetical protein [Saprospiraceae bacterium]